MTRYRIAELPGDGVGTEVVEAARLVLDTVGFEADYIHGDIGWEFWKSEGNALPERTLELLRNTDCALFGAITSKPKDEAEKELDPSLKNKGHVYFSPIVGMRQLFQLHTNMRPCRSYRGNPLNVKEGIDLVVFRENTEGLYAGIEWCPLPDEVREAFLRHHRKWAPFQEFPGEDVAVSLRVISRRGAERILRSGFEYARKFKRTRLTLAEKPNVLRETSGLMTKVAREMAKDYPDVSMDEANVDAMAMWLVKDPDKYQVIVASNLFGDILSDLGGGLVGGLGFAASANLGDDYAVFEPTHGSAPKYAGKGVVNPTAMILASKLMLDHLGETGMGARIEKAVAEVIQEGAVRTKDLGGTSSTMEMTKAIASKL
ncbi:MAG: isocitrate/isopropylmalate dehydrogenase family protein [Candidatus Thermoplasmatota archaeon]|nr:isocitrate/isopropylmalate dehydrogenase family protein [Candidatus Thermoplasmatota archaeon]